MSKELRCDIYLEEKYCEQMDYFLMKRLSKLNFNMEKILGSDYKVELNVDGDKADGEYSVWCDIKLLKDNEVISISNHKVNFIDDLFNPIKIELEMNDLVLYFRFKLKYNPTEFCFEDYALRELMDLQYKATKEFLEQQEDLLKSTTYYDLSDDIDLFVILRYFLENKDNISEEDKKYFKERLLYYGYDESFISKEYDTVNTCCNLNLGLLDNIELALKVIYNKEVEGFDSIYNKIGFNLYQTNGVPF